MTHLAIHLSGIHLKLASEAGEVNILNGIDLQVAVGETLGLVGPSGSGKSSLMMIMAGLERPSQGSAVILGKTLGKMSEDALALFRRSHVGIVFQSFHLIPTMTALENVAIPLELAGKRGALKQAKALLERVGLQARLSHYPSQLSGGEQQRVALARAFAAKPGLLLADEPTGNLDQTTGEGVIDLLFDLNRNSGATLVLITHDANLAGRCSRVARLKDGRLEGEAS
ncbi:MAG: ABC transporter ATP-binding protein [Alphaproteobacteria bacterium]|nr:ABC transporter ATP-binding protein [Alphaproteobacteria bacterium]